MNEIQACIMQQDSFPVAVVVPAFNDDGFNKRTMGVSVLSMHHNY